MQIIINVYHQQRPEQPTEDNPHQRLWEPPYDREAPEFFKGIPWQDPKNHEGDAGGYLKVATIPFEDVSEKDAKDYAWYLTNHVDCAWTSRDGTRLVVHGERHRSSMVGDVFELMLIDGEEVERKLLMVDHTGFKELP